MKQLKRFYKQTGIGVKMLFIGIDPGKDGALYAIDTVNETVTHKDFNASSDFALYLFLVRCKIKHNNNYICGIEQVNSRPEDGVVQAFSFGGQAQRIKTIMNVAGIIYREVNPQRWQNYLGWGRLPRGKQNYKARKKELYKIAKEMTDYSGLSAGNCDAYLIAKYLESTSKDKKKPP